MWPPGMILKPPGLQRWKYFRCLAILVSVPLITLYYFYISLNDTMIIDLFRAPKDDEGNFGSFLVSSPNCQIPNLDHFHESVRKFLYLGDPIVCSTKSPLTYVTMASDGAWKYLLNVNTTAMADYAVEPENVGCCYSVINRVNDPAGKKYSRDSDNHYSVTECSDFKTGLVLKSEEEFILVRCFQENENGTNKDIYKNTHAVVPKKAAVELKLNKISSESSSMEGDSVFFYWDSMHCRASTYCAPCRKQ